jgi:hypothetical protein
MLKKRARNYKVSDWLIFYSLANLIWAWIENDKRYVMILLVKD